MSGHFQRITVAVYRTNCFEFEPMATGGTVRRDRCVWISHFVRFALFRAHERAEAMRKIRTTGRKHLSNDNKQTYRRYVNILKTYVTFRVCTCYDWHVYYDDNGRFSAPVFVFGAADILNLSKKGCVVCKMMSDDDDDKVNSFPFFTVDTHRNQLERRDLYCIE